jgi:hypothetical protein
MESGTKQIVPGFQGNASFTFVRFCGSGKDTNLLREGPIADLALARGLRYDPLTPYFPLRIP